MPYPNRIKQLSKVQKMVFIAMLIAFALVLSYVERSFGVILPIPGVKLGLANIVTLASLYLLTFHEALLLVMLRVILNCFFVGFQTFWFSLSGGLLSLVVMYCLLRIGKEKVSTIGVSVVGAVNHNIGQLIVIAIITNSVDVAASYFPVLAVSGIITGVLVGITVGYLLPYLNRLFR
ncbi:Gx transporter family protein [Vallitalea pronyensis]|uniref:Gx transporter family protein n=1 Tax=Vallitalea pronyensis TaxID=1348613 RepID=A0A8J8SFV2_9FIRM|nr:Gx transporter family protein [Vallitalea pronyensis]QUI21719.1 Gx transporter family protein [Vallitalea pronyensis]